METNVPQPEPSQVDAGQNDNPQLETQVGGRLNRLWRENWVLLLVVGGIVAAFLVLRTSASAVGSVHEVEAILTDGTPTLVEFYSNT